MIVEKRSRIRKSYVNYAGTLAATSGSNLSPLDVALSKPAPNRKITPYHPVIGSVHNFSSAADWDDESVLETQTTPILPVYFFALITAVAFFAIGYYFFVG